MANKKQVLDAMGQYPEWNSEKIAAALGCCGAYVRATARRNGRSFDARRPIATYAHVNEWFRPLSAEELVEAQHLWADGFDTKDIADQLGRRESLIYNTVLIRSEARLPTGKSEPAVARMVTL